MGLKPTNEAAPPLSDWIQAQADRRIPVMWALPLPLLIWAGAAGYHMREGSLLLETARQTINNQAAIPIFEKAANEFGQGGLLSLLSLGEIVPTIAIAIHNFVEGHSGPRLSTFVLPQLARGIRALGN